MADIHTQKPQGGPEGLRVGLGKQHCLAGINELELDIRWLGYKKHKPLRG